MADVTAVVAVRNEEAYLANCLRHLVRNGVAFAIIDHDSSDATPSVYRRAEFAANLVDVVRLPFTGAFSLTAQLRAKMAVVERLQTDWVIHADADEEMDSYRAGETLAGALRRIGAAGWNAVDFDEFVFMPVDHDYVSDTQLPQPMRYYYFFSPHVPRLMRAWRRDAALSMVEQGGHILTGESLRLAPERLALRHYVVRSRPHAFDKYTRARLRPAGDRARLAPRSRRGAAWRSRFPPAISSGCRTRPRARSIESEPWKASLLATRLRRI